MSSHRRSRRLLFALILAFCFVPGVSFVAALPWLKQQSDQLVLTFAAIASTLTVVAAFALAILHERQLDEWERSNLRFSVNWGWAAASTLIAVLLSLPPIHDLIVHWAAIWGGTPNPDRRLVVSTFTFGFMAVVITQTVCTALVSIGWTLWKSRAPREPA